MTTIGVVHPGAMGAVVGAELARVRPGSVYWCPSGRSAATAARAGQAGLTAAASLADLAARSSVILSICPPDQAVAMAEAVAATGFDGCYVDANAIAPATMTAIAELLPDVVDGGIVGPPPHQPGSTRLYLSGPAPERVAGLFVDTNIEVRVVGHDVGAASAVKMCFAAWTKGSAALLLAVRAAARSHGVEAALLGEWETSMPELALRSERTAAGTGPKAWRFAGEMEEIAATFAAGGMPDGFHLGAAELYRGLSALKDRTEPSIDDVLNELLDQ